MITFLFHWKYIDKHIDVHPLLDFLNTNHSFIKSPNKKKRNLKGIKKTELYTNNFFPESQLFTD